MRSLRYISLSLATLGACAVPAAASVVISSAATQNMNCYANACVPTAPEAVLNVLDLENMLATGGAKVSTMDGSGVCMCGEAIVGLQISLRNDSYITRR